jgi:hypothetical protein
MPDQPQASAWKAPYVAYPTLTNFIDVKLGSNPLPPRIDRGFLETYSGSVRPLLLQALRTMGLVGEAGEVLAPLREAARSTDLRKKILGEWARLFYVEQIELAGQHATSTMLQESFAKHQYQGSTLRKAIVFYLSLTDDVGLPKSPHFKAPKQVGVGPGRSRSRHTVAAEALPQRVVPPSTGVYSLTVRLTSGGTVTLTVDVNPLALKGDERQFFYSVVDLLDSYQEAGGSPQRSSEGAQVVEGES